MGWGKSHGNPNFPKWDGELIRHTHFPMLRGQPSHYASTVELACISSHEHTMDRASTSNNLRLDNRKFSKHVLDLDASPMCLCFYSGSDFQNELEYLGLLHRHI